MRKEFNFRAGGAAGDGIASMGEILTKICSRNGLHVSSYNTYQSLIRGGHVWYSIRGAVDKVRAPGDRIDILIAIDELTVETHKNLMNPGGVIIYDGSKCKVENVPDGVTPVSIPAKDIAKSLGNPRVINTVALGAAMYFYDIPLDSIFEILTDQFGYKSQEIVDINHKAAKAGYDYVKEQNFPKISHEVKLNPNTKHPVMTGSQAQGLGCIAGGLKFYSAYPMTPASPILHFLAAHAEQYDVLVKQAEDELSVINMAIGASNVGVRAACGTSGGGFALMTEAVGLASMVEAPLVIFLAMRGGPSTGLPTKTEQGDLNQLYGASQGDFPRIIIAYSNVEDCFYTTAEALNLADKYQLPVMLASDLGLAEHLESVSPFNFNEVKIDRAESFVTKWESDSKYLRFKITDSGITPRVIPGTPNAFYISGSDEHDEDSSNISDVVAGLPHAIEMRKKQMHKRMGKMEAALKDMPAPKLEGPEDAEVTLVGWGSTKDYILEARQMLEQDGITTNQLHIKYILPFHGYEVGEILRKVKKPVMIEGNYTGQMARHIRAETGFNIEEKFLHFDGEPMYPRLIVERVKEILRRQ
ncbi:MAG: 2-oxoacid:acceptor oxidoreductase subunit alpha [Candidatus Kariarchaeaceae archaeon]|jgi:2-oxoglutarate ferredoxin oxidoreductase subunit alpha